MNHPFAPARIPLFTVGMLVVAVSSCVVLELLSSPNPPGLHTVLDTTMFVLSGLLALLFSEIGARSRDPFARWIGISFGLASLCEFIHTIVSIDWSGPLAHLTQAVGIGGPSTWPVPAHLLPIGIGFSLWLKRQSVSRRIGLAMILTTLTVGLFMSFRLLPAYSAPGWFGITRPTLIVAPLLCGLVGVFCRGQQAKDRTLPLLSVMAAILFLAHTAMLYSRSPHDAQAMLAHLGTVGAYLFVLLSLMYMASTDIVERTRAEERFRGLMEAAPDALVVVNHEGKIVLINTQAENLFGYESGQILGKDIEMLLPDRFRERHQHHRINFFTEPRVRPMGAGLELYGQHKDGHEFPVEISLSPLETDAGVLVSSAIRDITSRKQIEAALRLSEEKFRLLISGVTDYSIITLDRAGYITTWNAGAEKITGYKALEITGHHFSEFYQAEDVQQGKPAHELKMAEQEGRSEDEGWRVRKDGSRFWANVNITALRDDKGLLFGFGKITRDMTARRRAEQKFSGLLEAAPDAMVVVDHGGRMVLVNAQAEKLFGYGREELVGNLIEMLIPERYRGKHAGHRGNFFSDARTRPMGIGLELFGLHKDGREFPVEISLSPLETEEGQFVSSAIRDITERKKAEALLRLSEERRRLIVETALSAFVAMDSQGKIVDWNRQAELIFGWPREEAMGQPMIDLIVPPEHREEHTRGVQRFLATGDGPMLNRRIETVALHRDGHQVPVELTIAPLQWSNRYTFNAFIQDISMRKHAEEDIRKRTDELAAANAGLAAANKELEAFTYSVAHDLRAPLRHVLGYSKVLTEDFGSSLSSEGQECVRDISRSAEHMSHLIDDLLALARIGRQELAISLTGLASIINEVREDLVHDALDRDIQWKVGDLPFVECDRGLIKQVFVNLLSNAIKYTRPRHPALIEIGHKTEDGQFVFFVRDNGVGFNMKYADKLFGVFQRLHRREDFEGTGVGLATVQRIIYKHGGHIWAEAEMNKGATFYFTLSTSPRRDSTEPANTAEVRNG